MADRFQELNAFVAVAECRGFAPAARKLHLSPAAMTRAIAALEHRLGLRLFQRSTRAVSLTDDGIAFLESARRILADLRDADQAVMGRRTAAAGRLYVTAPVMFGQLHVLPVIAQLLAAHPDLSAEMMLIDRNVRLVEEGIDVAVRIGRLAPSALRVVPIGFVTEVLVASPAYLAKHGVPGQPRDLALHHAVATAGVRMGNDWTVGAETVKTTPRVTVNTVAAAVAAAEAGLGVANLLSYQVADAVAAGRLTPILGERGYTDPVPVSLLFDAGRAAIPSVRAFIEAMKSRAMAGRWH